MVASKLTDFQSFLNLVFLSLLFLQLQTIALLQPAFGRDVVRIRFAKFFKKRSDTGDGNGPTLCGLVIAMREVAQRRSGREQRE
jgi:hypothetical protein